MIWFLLLVVITWSGSVTDGANILGIFPAASYSHQLFYRRYLKELHGRGHNLTVFTPNPLNDSSMKNYREVDLGYLYDEYRKIIDVSSSTGKKNRIFAEVLFYIFTKIVLATCHGLLSNEDVMGVYRRKEKFDLVVAEWGLFTCHLPFEKLSDGKLMGITSFELGTMSHLTIGSVRNPAVNADTVLEYTDRMSFFQRLRSVVYHFNSYLYTWLIRKMEADVAREYFGPHITNPCDIESNVSIVLDNSHVTMTYPKPNSLNSIGVGGPAFHLIGLRPQPLPKDIKDFLDEAPDGVIYFSLGTNVKTNNISNEEEKILMKSFGKIKQKVLWKWDNEKLQVNLKNVMKRKWFPQADILAHPNVKAFVTQAGLQSVGEAIEYQVPMITMPFFADQNHNARKMEREGVSLYLDYDTLNVDTFTQALNEVIYNRKYKENMKRFSALVRDQPIPPLEKAVWWTEYVIRHNGAPHLKSPAVKMPWYQYFMLDVLAVISLVLFLFFYVTYIILKYLFRKLFNNRKPKED